MNDDAWERSKTERMSQLGSAGMSVLRITLLFGSAAIALALLAVPLLEDGTRSYTAQSGVLPEGVDPMSTGSIDRSGRYTLRKSVLQPSPDSVCVIREGGTRSGQC